MARYIDADKLKRQYGYLDTGLTRIMPIEFVDADDVEKAPTEDVVEVVRCKNCENYSGKYCCLTDDTEDQREPDDYCSYGERKDI